MTNPYWKIRMPNSKFKTIKFNIILFKNLIKNNLFPVFSNWFNLIMFMHDGKFHKSPPLQWTSDYLIERAFILNKFALKLSWSFLAWLFKANAVACSSKCPQGEWDEDMLSFDTTR